LRNWSRFIRQGAVSSQARHVQRLELHQNLAVRSLVTSSRLFSQEPAQQLEATQDDLPEDESKSNSSQSRQLEHLDRQLYKLDMDVRRTGRTLPHDLNMIMEKITPEFPCTSNQALMILRCCGSLLSDEKIAQRTERVEKYWKTFQELGISLDVSHYNALLKVHIENEHKIVPSDFLSHMEDMGVSPNRVTFQHMIGLYCLDGNITGATTILEHMKSQEMAINHSVFDYLLQGHCFNDDQASVDSTLEIMSSSGLDLGSDTIRVMAIAHGKLGRWEKVQEVFAKAEEADVKLSDGDVFEIIQALCQGGLEAEAREILGKLPKKRGYFQELRSAVPQIIFTGCINLALEIFFAFKVIPTKTSGEHHDESERRDKGAFIVRSIVKAEADVDKILDVVKQMEEAGYNDWLWLVVEASIQFGSVDFCQKIGEGLTDKLGKNFMDMRQLFPFIRKQVVIQCLEGNPTKVFDMLNKIRALGLQVPKESLSNDVIPALLDLDKQNPGQCVYMLMEAVPSMNWVFLSNAMIQSLLNQEKLEHFRACSGFLLNSKIGSMYSDTWNNSLARAYLTTDSLEDLINVLFIASRPWNYPKSSRGRDDGADFNEVLFRTLSHIVKQGYRYRPDQEKADILRPVVQELNKLRIGIPAQNVKVLKQMIDDDSDVQKLLDEAGTIFTEDYWTQERSNEFLEQRRTLYGRTRRDGSPQENHNFGERSKHTNIIPDDIEKMEKMKTFLDKRGEVNRILTSNLIKSYNTAGQIDKSIELLNTTENFHGSPTDLQDIVENLVNAGNVDKALDFYRSRREDGDSEMFASTLITVCIGLAKEGKHTAVLDLLGEDTEKLINNRSYWNNAPLLEHYVQAGDVENLGSVFEAMGRVNLIKTGDGKILAKLVQVHLVKEDTKAAVQEFERICQTHKTLAHKFSLMEKLIEDEDLEAMQKVLDLSIEIIGEEKSLYDLAHNFLSSGKKAQTKKLFETPGLRYNHYKMEYLSQFLTEHGHLEALEDLVTLSKNIFGCDRDYMYTQLVKANRNDPNKALDIWENIQEEGVAPSDNLKIEIANILQAAGKTVPFEVPEKPMAMEVKQERKQPKQTQERKEPKQMQDRNEETQDRVKRKSENKEKEAKHLELRDAVISAAKSGDIESMMSTLASSDATRVLHVTALQNIVEHGSLEDACKVANEVKTIKTRKMKNQMDSLFQKMKTSQREDLMTSMFDGMDEEQKSFYSRDTWMYSTKAYNNPEWYLDQVRASADPTSSVTKMVGPMALNQAMEKNKELGEGLNALAKEGSETAAVILSLVSLDKGDKTEFVKNWNLIKNNEVSSDIILNSRGLSFPEKLRFTVDVLKELKAPQEAVKMSYITYFNRFNRSNNFNRDDIIAEALANGVELKNLNVKFLEHLSKQAKSKYKDEAVNILAEKQHSD